jgi:hypothetical protein
MQASADVDAHIIDCSLVCWRAIPACAWDAVASRTTRTGHVGHVHSSLVWIALVEQLLAGFWGEWTLL